MGRFRQVAVRLQNGKARLTVIVPVNGRPEFTERFLRHSQGMPYKVRIVPNSSLSEYFSKTSAALDAVDTPYAMRADNDDFLSMSGIERSLDFLEANPDYVASSGLIAGFSVFGPRQPVAGRLGRRCRYYPSAEPLNQPTAASRLERWSNRLWVYYAIHRTAAMRTISAEIRQIDFSDLLLYEAFCVMRALILGKVHLDERISYFRQYGTSTSSGQLREWPRHFLFSRFTSDVRAMLQFLADGLSATELQESMAIIQSALDEKLRHFLRAQFSDFRWLRFLVPLCHAFERKLPLREFASVRTTLECGQNQSH